MSEYIPTTFANQILNAWSQGAEAVQQLTLQHAHDRAFQGSDDELKEFVSAKLAEKRSPENFLYQLTEFLRGRTAEAESANS